MTRRTKQLRAFEGSWNPRWSAFVPWSHLLRARPNLTNAFDVIQEHAHRLTWKKIQNNNAYFLDERIPSVLLSQSLSSPLRGRIHVTRTSRTDLNFEFKPLLRLHLDYVNNKPEPCEIQNREHLILVQDKTGLSASCHTFRMGERRASPTFKVFSYPAIGCFACCLVPAAHLLLYNFHSSASWIFIGRGSRCPVTTQPGQHLLFIGRDVSVGRRLEMVTRVPKAQPWR